jgi:hypothetical protein
LLSATSEWGYPIANHEATYIFPLSFAEEALSCLWHLRKERHNAFGDTTSNLHLVARWERGILSQLLPIFQHAVDTTMATKVEADEVAVSLVPTHFSFLIYALTTIDRWSKPTSDNSSDVRGRFLADLWKQVDESTPFVMVVPAGPLIEVIIPHLRFTQRMHNAGIQPPPDVASKDDWHDRFLGHIERVTAEYERRHEGSIASKLLPIPCTYEDVIKLFGSALGIQRSSSDNIERKATSDIISYVSWFMDPESRRYANSQAFRSVGESETPEQSTTLHGQQSDYYATPVTLECLYCRSKFVTSNNSPKCMNCDPLLKAWVDSLSTSQPALADETLREWSRLKVMPPALPISSLVAGGIVAFLAALATLFAGRWGLYLILLFPIAIGFPTGYVMGRITTGKSLFVRTYYWTLPLLVGITAYCSTFYLDYELTINDLEQAGFTNVRAAISFATYMEVMADQPFEITRNTQTFSDEGGNPSNWYFLWALEGGIVSLSAFRGWKKGLSTSTGVDTAPR